MHRTFSLIVWLQIYEINTYSQPLLTCFWKWIIDVLHKNDTNCFKCIKIYYLFYYQTADWCKIMKNCQQLIWQRSQLIRQRKLDCHGNWQDQHNIFLTKKTFIELLTVNWLAGIFLVPVSVNFISLARYWRRRLRSANASKISATLKKESKDASSEKDRSKFDSES